MKTQFVIKFVMFALLAVLFPSLGLSAYGTISLSCEENKYALLVGERVKCYAKLEPVVENANVTLQTRGGCSLAEASSRTDSSGIVTFTLEARDSEEKCELWITYENYKRPSPSLFTIDPAYYVEITGPTTLEVGDEAVYDLQLKQKISLKKEEKLEEEVRLKIDAPGENAKVIKLIEITGTTNSKGRSRIKIRALKPAVDAKIITIRPKHIQGVESELVININPKEIITPTCVIYNVPEYNVFNLSIQIEGERWKLTSQRTILKKSPGKYSAQLILESYDEEKLKNMLRDYTSDEEIINEILKILNGKIGQVIWPLKGEMEVECS